MTNKVQKAAAHIYPDPAVINKLKAGDFQALARVLTWAEKSGPEVFFSHPQWTISEPNPSASLVFRLGITGPPGAGKSTLINELIRSLRALQLKVAVLAVDPSSPFTQGAILGDRIRYSEHFNDPGVFIRSVGTRGSLGGLSAASYLMLRVLDSAPFDVVLVETVGVGQTELEILNVADSIAVVLVPESGDSIQAMKAGLTEIADFFIINKSDRPGAEGLKNELRATLELAEMTKSLEIFLTQALHSKGIQEVVDYVLQQKAKVNWQKRQSIKRLRAEAKSLLRWRLESQIESQIENIASPSEFISIVSRISK